MSAREVTIAPAADGELDLFCAIATRAIPRRPRSPEFTRHLQRRDPEAAFVLGRLDGEPVATGAAFRIAWLGDAKTIVGGVQVLPEHRSRGVGTAVFEWLCEQARARGMTTFGTSIDADQPEGRRFAERHGFTLDDTVRSVSLDLRRVPEEDVQLPDGIEIVSYADRPDTARGMWHVDLLAARDIPQTTPNVDLTFDEWRAEFMERPGFLPEAVLAALDGDGVVGFAALALDVARPVRAWHNMTAVLASHRGRGIAVALKRTQIQWARRNGLEELQTGNHDANAPMRAVNRKLGYTPLPDEYMLSKQL